MWAVSADFEAILQRGAVARDLPFDFVGLLDQTGEVDHLLLLGGMHGRLVVAETLDDSPYKLHVPAVVVGLPLKSHDGG